MERVLKLAAIWGLILVAAGCLWVRGFVPGSRGTPLDFHYFYAAGSVLADGGNPYDFEVFAHRYTALRGDAPKTGVVYPPQALSLFAVLALLEPASAMMALAVVNVLAAGVLAYLALLWVTRAIDPTSVSEAWLTRGLLPAVVLAMPPTAHWIYTGQVTLPAMALVIAGWIALRGNASITAGVLFGLATYKPQYVALTIVWLLLDRQWRSLAVAACVSLMLAAPAVARLGISPAIFGWLGAMSSYNVDANLPGHPMVMGVPSVLAALGWVQLSPFVALLFGLVFVVGLWWGRSSLAPDAVAGLVLGGQVVLGYGKYIDMLMLIPLLSFVWLRLGRNRLAWPWLILGLGWMLLPYRLCLMLDWPELSHARMVGFLGALAVGLVLALSRDAKSGSESALD